MQFSGVIKLDQGWIAAESPNVDILFDQKTIFQFKVQLDETSSLEYIRSSIATSDYL